MYNFDTYIDLIFLKPLLKVGQDGLGFDKSLCAGLYRASHRQATGGHHRGGHRRRAPRGHSYWNGRHTLQVSQVGVASRGLVHPSGKFQGRRRMVEVCKIDFQIMYPYFLIWGTMGQKLLWNCSIIYFLDFHICLFVCLGFHLGSAAKSATNGGINFQIMYLYFLISHWGKKYYEKIIKWHMNVLISRENSRVSGKLQGRQRMVEVCKIDFQIMVPVLSYFTMGRKYLCIFIMEENSLSVFCDNASAAFLSFHMYSNFEFRMPLASLKYVVCA